MGGSPCPNPSNTAHLTAAGALRVPRGVPPAGSADFTIRPSRVNICGDSQRGFSALVLAPEDPRGYFLGSLTARDYPQATSKGFVRIPGQLRRQSLGSMTPSVPPPPEVAALMVLEVTAPHPGKVNDASVRLVVWRPCPASWDRQTIYEPVTHRKSERQVPGSQQARTGALPL